MHTKNVLKDQQNKDNQKMRGNIFWKELNIEKHPRVPIWEKAKTLWDFYPCILQ